MGRRGLSGLLGRWKWGIRLHAVPKGVALGVCGQAHEFFIFFSSGCADSRAQPLAMIHKSPASSVAGPAFGRLPSPHGVNQT